MGYNIDDKIQDWQYAERQEIEADRLAEHDAHVESEGVGHGLVHEIGDAIGYLPLLVLIVLGAMWFFRKKLQDFFKR